jgi:probable addiction module antidote protein
MVNVVELQTFDVIDYLDSEETIAEYLSQVLADGDSDELLRAIGYIAKAQDIGKIVQNSGSYP